MTLSGHVFAFSSTWTTTRSFLISRLKEDVDRERQKLFFLFLNLESGGKNPTAGEFFFSGLEDIFVWLFCVTTQEH